MNATPASMAATTVATATSRSCGPHHSGPSGTEPSGAVPIPTRLRNLTAAHHARKQPAPEFSHRTTAHDIEPPRPNGMVALAPVGALSG
jgi:hypothetical protein